MSFFEELKRRNVFRVGIAYGVTSWVLLQVADLILDNVEAPSWVMDVFMMMVVLGFVMALVIAWAYEMTTEGIKRETEVERGQSVTHQTAKKLDVITLAAIGVLIVFMLVDRFVLKPSQAEVATPVEIAETTPEAAPATPEPTVAENSIAVIPFVAMSSGEDDEYFADGLTEEILNSLAQLPELLITARTSSFYFKGQDIPVQEIAEKLGVQNIVEGSVRRSGDRLRVTAQLVRATDGFHLWSQNYDSTSDDTIQVQEDIAEKIALAMNVVIDDGKREAMHSAGVRDVEAFIAYQKGVDLYGKAHGVIEQMDGLREANRYFEIAIKRAPEFAAAYLRRSDFWVHIVNNQANGKPQPNVSEEELAAAYENAVRDMQAAQEFAPNASLRAAAETDHAIFTGNWRGLSGRIERLLTDRSCNSAVWLPGVAMVFGYSERFVERAQFRRRCDPLRSTSWFNEVRALLWAGNPAESVKRSLEGLELVDSSWLITSLMHALVAGGEFETAMQLVNSRLQFEEDIVFSRMTVMAAQGDLDKLTKEYERFQQTKYAYPLYEFLVQAWMGNHEAVNELAAQVDAHQVGPFTLVLLTNRCACGAPFDLESTPNFARKIEEADLPWPPPSPIKWPLKDW